MCYPNFCAGKFGHGNCCCVVVWRQSPFWERMYAIVQCLFSWTKTHDQITYCLKHASNTSLCKQIGMFRLLVICSLHKTQVCVIESACWGTSSCFKGFFSGRTSLLFLLWYVLAAVRQIELRWAVRAQGARVIFA